jgi:hypothetical protein
VALEETSPNVIHHRHITHCSDLEGSINPCIRKKSSRTRTYQNHEIVPREKPDVLGCVAKDILNPHSNSASDVCKGRAGLKTEAIEDKPSGESYTDTDELLAELSYYEKIQI